MLILMITQYTDEGYNEAQYCVAWLFCPLDHCCTHQIFLLFSKNSLYSLHLWP